MIDANVTSEYSPLNFKFLLNTTNFFIEFIPNFRGMNVHGLLESTSVQEPKMARKPILSTIYQNPSIFIGKLILFSLVAELHPQLSSVQEGGPHRRVVVSETRIPSTSYA